MTDSRIPAVVMALSRCVAQLGPLPPHPCAWKEYPNAWVVVFDDGRKIRFEKAACAEDARGRVPVSGSGDLRSERTAGSGDPRRAELLRAARAGRRKPKS